VPVAREVARFRRRGAALRVKYVQKGNAEYTSIYADGLLVVTVVTKATRSAK